MNRTSQTAPDGTPVPDPAPLPTDDADLRLGRVVRARRHAQGSTLVEIARASELSHSFLSQLERGRARPSMRSLFLIAQALGTTQQTLLAEAAPPSATSSSIDVGQRGVAGSGTARLLSHVDDGADVTEFVNVPATFDDYFCHGRHEFVYVISGQLEVELSPHDASAGDADGPGTSAGTSDSATAQTQLHLLGPRESLGYPGSVRHRHRRVGPQDCVILVVHSGPEDLPGAQHTH